jgi:hypothetical protein
MRDLRGGIWVGGRTYCSLTNPFFPYLDGLRRDQDCRRSSKIFMSIEKIASIAFPGKEQQSIFTFSEARQGSP